MGVLDTLRETVSLIQKVDNIDLYRQTMELQTQVFALADENRALKSADFDRRGHEFRQWPTLSRTLATSLRCRSAIVDGEIACLDADGRSNFYALLFRRRAPFSVRSIC